MYVCRWAQNWSFQGMGVRIISKSWTLWSIAGSAFLVRHSCTMCYHAVSAHTESSWIILNHARSAHESAHPEPCHVSSPWICDQYRRPYMWFSQQWLMSLAFPVVLVMEHAHLYILLYIIPAATVAACMPSFTLASLCKHVQSTLQTIF